MDLVRNKLDSVKTLPNILTMQEITIPDSAAVIYKDKEYTYKELNVLVSQFVNRILKHHKDLKHIGALLPRGVNYLIAYFASAKLGVPFVPIGSNSTLNEIQATIEYCDINLLIYDSSTKDLADKGNNVLGIMINEEEYFETVNEEEVSLGNPTPNSTAVLLHTSGSTSDPKRVMLTHNNIIANARSHALHMGLHSKDRALIVIPLNFVYANTAQMAVHLLLGSTLVLLDGIFSPRRFYEMIDNYKINVTTLVPTMLQQIASFKCPNKYNASHLHQVTFGGAPFSTTLIKQAKTALPNTNFYNTYGLTEAGSRVSAASVQSTLKGAAGKPLPDVEIEILNEDKTPVSNGEIGEVYIKSPGVMKGYYKREDETKRIMYSGWLRSGDLGKWVDGDLYIVGRIKNIIIRAGVNIYPEEIESYLKTHPKIRDVIVKGIPHSILGEEPHALILCEDEKITLKELKTFAKQGLSSYKIPSFELVESIPYTYNNKVQRV